MKISGDAGWDAVALALIALAVTYFVVFVFRFFREMPKVYKEAVDKADRATEQLLEISRPKLKLVFDATMSGCILPAGFNLPVMTSAGPSTKLVAADWYRIKVDTDDCLEARDCLGRLNSIEKNGIEVFRGEPVRLPFAPAGRADQYSKHVYDGTSEWLDFLMITETNKVLIRTDGFSYPQSFNFWNMLDDPAQYTIRVTVVIPGNKSVLADIHFTWTGDRKTSVIQCVSPPAQNPLPAVATASTPS